MIHKGIEYTVTQDEDPTNPRERSNIWKMVCTHKKYRLGDEAIDTSFTSNRRNAFAFHISTSESECDIDFYDLEDTIEEKVFVVGKVYEWIDQHVVYLPLYLYDHSRVTMSTTPFSCGFDSGKVWFIYVLKSNPEVQWLSDEKIKEYLVSEVKTYDQYLTGDVYCYDIPEINDNLCWLFWWQEAIDTAIEAIDHYVNNNKQVEYTYSTTITTSMRIPKDEDVVDHIKSKLLDTCTLLSYKELPHENKDPEGNQGDTVQ